VRHKNRHDLGKLFKDTLHGRVYLLRGKKAGLVDPLDVATALDLLLGPPSPSSALVGAVLRAVLLALERRVDNLDL